MTDAGLTHAVIVGGAWLGVAAALLSNSVGGPGVFLMLAVAIALSRDLWSRFVVKDLWSDGAGTLRYSSTVAVRFLDR